MSDNNRSWTEYFRIITPFLLIVLTFLGGTINSSLNRLDLKIDALDAKVFKHLTNDDIHMSRSAVVDKNVFEIYQRMRDKQMIDMQCTLTDIREMLIDHVEKKK